MKRNWRGVCSEPPTNGNQVAVLNAIRQGVSDPRAISSWLGIEESAVRNAIKRLVYESKIRRKVLGGYEPVAEQRCLLAEVWR